MQKMLTYVAAALSLLPANMNAQTKQEPTTQDFINNFSVDPQKYAGTWYEIARTENNFEDNRPWQLMGGRLSVCTKVTATYTLRDETTIEVLNKCIRTDKNGKEVEKKAQGIAKIVADSNNRKLQVAFGPKVLQYFIRLFLNKQGNYWIYDLGPEKNNEYQWAVVSGPKKDYLWILSRTKTLDDATYKNIIEHARAAKLPVDQLKLTPQE